MADLAGIIFDIDGTLIDSGLDFDLIRAEMNIPPGAEILETLDQLPAVEAEHCRQVLARHEERGAAEGLPFAGVNEFLIDLERRRIRFAAVTRNRQELACQMLAHLSASFEVILGRENGPIKPDPWAILSICQQWKVKPQQVIFLGDYLFDMQAGRNAGARTVLFSRGRSAEQLVASTALADHLLDSFLETDLFWEWVSKSF